MVIIPNLIFGTKAKKLLRKRCIAQIAVVSDFKIKDTKMNQVTVAKKFQNVFLNELPRLPPNREIEFTIKVISGIKPISISSYRMALAKLKELNVKL